MAPLPTQSSSTLGWIEGSPRPTPEAKGGGFLFEFLDLRAQFDTIKDEITKALAIVMESQQFILGREVQSFENEMAALIGTRAAVGCASGSDALLLAIMALGIGPGDEVITTPFTFVATAGMIARVGAKPVFVDIHKETFNIDPGSIRAAINERTRAIIPVHLFGLPADLDPILKVAEEHNLAVIEDAAQAIGAQYRSTAVGSVGTFGCFSFFPSKNLGGAGDGGMITTNDPELAERIRLLRAHGSRLKYHSEILGINSRLDALQAAILRVKLTHLEDWICARRGKADHYRALIVENRLEEHIQLPTAPGKQFHVYNQFVIRSQRRDLLREWLRARGVPTEVYYPLPLHLQSAFAYLGYKSGQFPQAEAASEEALALPIYPELKEEHQAAVVHGIADFYAQAN